MPSLRSNLLIIGALVVAGLVAVYVMRTPSNERVWRDYLAQPTVIEERADATYLFTDVRDWSYDASGPVTREYVDAVYDPASVTSMNFVMEPFPENPMFGHTYLVFEFTDAPPLAFSVEARMEADEEYSPWLGPVNTFELAYTWGSEEDFETRRTTMLGHELYDYQLDVTPEIARTVFRAFVEGAQELALRPRFYNTFAHNCTNELAQLINKEAPGSLPWDPSRFFTGTADEYLYELGYIKGESFEAARQAAKVSE